jgi:hypothetical protein
MVVELKHIYSLTRSSEKFNGASMQSEVNSAFLPLKCKIQFIRYPAADLADPKIFHKIGCCS